MTDSHEDISFPDVDLFCDLSEVSTSEEEDPNSIEQIEKSAKEKSKKTKVSYTNYTKPHSSDVDHEILIKKASVAESAKEMLTLLQMCPQYDFCFQG